MRIDSFRNLSKEKVMEFAPMIPYMEKEVAIEMIKQFPVYAEFAKAFTNNYTDVCKEISALTYELIKYLQLNMCLVLTSIAVIL